jgi:hypothetical protein
MPALEPFEKKRSTPLCLKVLIICHSFGVAPTRRDDYDPDLSSITNCKLTLCKLTRASALGIGARHAAEAARRWELMIGRGLTRPHNTSSAFKLATVLGLSVALSSQVLAAPRLPSAGILVPIVGFLGQRTGEHKPLHHPHHVPSPQTGTYAARYGGAAGSRQCERESTTHPQVFALHARSPCQTRACPVLRSEPRRNTANKRSFVFS